MIWRLNVMFCSVFFCFFSRFGVGKVISFLVLFVVFFLLRRVVFCHLVA